MRFTRWSREKRHRYIVQEVFVHTFLCGDTEVVSHSAVETEDHSPWCGGIVASQTTRYKILLVS
jgi:hypothetical protein